MPSSRTYLCFQPGEGWADGWDERTNVGIILHFIHGNWTVAANPTQQWLAGIRMLSASDGWMVGRNGTILHYNGTGWTQVKSPTTAFLANVAMISPSEGWAVGWNILADTGAILHYQNGSWSNYTSGGSSSV